MIRLIQRLPESMWERGDYCLRSAWFRGEETVEPADVSEEEENRRRQMNAMHALLIHINRTIDL